MVLFIAPTSTLFEEFDSRTITHYTLHEINSFLLQLPLASQAEVCVQISLDHPDIPGTMTPRLAARTPTRFLRTTRTQQTALYPANVLSNRLTVASQSQSYLSSCHATNDFDQHHQLRCSTNTPPHRLRSYSTINPNRPLGAKKCLYRQASASGTNRCSWIHWTSIDRLAQQTPSHQAEARVV